MRILLKILLFTITMALTIVLLICKFFCLFGTMLLSVLAFILFAFAIVIMIFLGEIQDGIKTMVLAYLISPYGIPLFAAWLLDKIEQFNEWVKAI